MKWPAWLTLPVWVYRLKDPLDPWRREDKAVHVGWSAWAMSLTRGQPLLARWIILIVLGLVVEGVQVVRWIAWQRRGGTGKWPFFTDKASVKDMVANLAGGALELVAEFVLFIMGSVL